VSMVFQEPGLLSGTQPIRALRGSLWKVIRGQPSATIGAFILGSFILLALLAPWVAPYGLHEQVGPVYGHPSWSHPLGLDDGGVDMVTLLMWGARISLVVGFAATFVSIVIGVLLWTGTARVVRAQVKSIRERVYVKRARSLGAGNVRIVVRHVLPQIAPLLIANTVLTIAVAIFDETALAFLGLGDPSRISLGKVIENAFQRTAITSGAWWAIVPPGAAVALLILSCSMIGRAMEDALNPRLKAAHLSARSFRLRPLVGRGKDAV